ncbi:MAG TPA: tetratricopeptide repeat protein [Steroidobacteraceae bacterium]|nr:tetratricopeptide repeat protein [Steroidobacteraceae bacterium]
MNQVYEAAAAGHLDQAQQMITQVLAHHPTSAKAHYVQAELFAKEGKTALARAELGSAERINPGLTEFTPRSVQELKAQLGLSPATRAMSPQIVSAPRAAPHIPWGGLLLGLIVVVALFALFRRRTPSVTQYPTAGPGVGGAPTGYGPGYGPAPMGGGGMGSGIAGGLASGLAVGAGVVAGEELAHHFLDGGRREGGVIPSAEAAEPGSNGDMGGNDFGANDPGSWDDGGGGMGGGGGDDWS